MKRIIVLGILLSLIVPIVAQEATDLDVVVTADRLEKEEIETTATVSVITAEEIDESAADSVVELLEVLPGVQFRSVSGPAQATVSMGGFGENSFGRVVVLVDGRVQNNLDMRAINWMSVPLESVERIEVLHGGGGVLYGNGAVGGVINIITKETDAPFEVEVGGKYGSFSTHGESVQVGASSALGSIRVGGEYYSTEGYRDRTGSNYANANIGGSLYPSDTLDLELDLNYTRSFYEMPGNLSESEYEDDPTQATITEDESTEHEFGGSLSGVYYLNDSLELNLLAAYGYKYMEVDTPSGFLIKYNDRTANTFDFKPMIIFNESLYSYPVTVSIGMDLRYSRLSSETFDDESRKNKSNEFDVGLNAVGGYVNTDIELVDSIGLTGGFRYESARIEATNQDGSVDDSKDHIGPAWSAGLRWNPSDHSKIYLRHEGLFRYPFTDEQASLYGSGDVFLDDLEAEKGQLYEIGGLFTIGSHLRFDLRAYVNNMQNEITYNSASSQNENLDETRRIGVDSSFSAIPITPLELSGSYGYVNAIFINGNDEDNRIPLVSEHEIETSITYLAPADIEIVLNGTYRSDFYQGGDTANNQEMVDGYFLLGSGISWGIPIGGGNLRLRAVAENLLQQDHASLVYYNSWTGESGYYPGQGRSFTLSGSYSF